MIKISSNSLSLEIDAENGVISSLKIKNYEVCVDKCPLFVIRLRDLDGKCYYINSTEGKLLSIGAAGFVYGGFSDTYGDISVTVSVLGGENISWGIEIQGVCDKYAIEYVEFPKICLPRLVENDKNGGRILFPYNEGMIVSDEKLLPRYEMEFPSSGAYFMFPNMVCSQFMAYLFEDFGLYIGAPEYKRICKASPSL